MSAPNSCSLRTAIDAWLTGEPLYAGEDAVYRADGCALLGSGHIWAFRIGDSVFYWTAMTGAEEHRLHQLAQAVGLRVSMCHHIIPVSFAERLTRLNDHRSHADLLSFVLQAHKHEFRQSKVSAVGYRHVTRVLYQRLCNAMQLDPMPQAVFGNWLRGALKLSK